MTKEQLTDLVRMLSAVETCLMMQQTSAPDHIYEQIDSFMEFAKKELTK